MSRTLPYLNTLSRTIPYVNTLSRAIPYLNALPSAANQIRVTRVVSQTESSITSPKSSRPGWRTLLGSSRLAMAYPKTWSPPPPTWSARYYWDCQLSCCIFVKTIFFNFSNLAVLLRSRLANGYSEFYWRFEIAQEGLKLFACDFLQAFFEEIRFYFGNTNNSVLQLSEIHSCVLDALTLAFAFLGSHFHWFLRLLQRKSCQFTFFHWAFDGKCESISNVIDVLSLEEIFVNKSACILFFEEQSYVWRRLSCVIFCRSDTARNCRTV